MQKKPYKRVKRDIVAMENPEYAELLAQKDEEDKARRAYLCGNSSSAASPIPTPAKT